MDSESKPLRTLILTIGPKKFLMENMLPSLYGAGQYNGDLIIVSNINENKFLPEDVAAVLAKYPDKKITFHYPKEILYKSYGTDRFRIYEYLLKPIYQNYDVIMSIDYDVEFFHPIAPLFEICKDTIGVTREHWLNEMIVEFKWRWQMLPDDYWQAIRTQRIINNGMFVGPADQMYALLKTCTNYLEYENYWGMEQMLFNAFVYYEKMEVQYLDPKWHSVAFEPYDKDTVVILHHCGPHDWKVKDPMFKIIEAHGKPVDLTRDVGQVPKRSRLIFQKH
jgi:hypothetical protein